jgi:hypothetical protein
MTPRSRALAGAGVVGFVLACVLVPQGLRSGAPYSDVHVYARYAGAMASGSVPYRDFFDEYPPLAQPVFLLARIAGAGHFALVFKLLMTACGAGALVLGVVVLERLGASLGQRVVAVAVTAASPLLVGSILLNAYDLWPALLLAGALAALLGGRPRLAFAVLGAAAAAKVYPLAAAPVAALYVARRWGRHMLRASLGWLAGVVVVANLPFVVLGPGGLRYSYWIQVKRGLELNSLGASLLLAAQRLGWYDATIANRPPGSDNLVGPAAGAVAAASSVVLVLAVVAVAVVFARSRRDGVALVRAAAAAVAVFVSFDKVFSAQYVDWLAPLAPLAGVAAAGVTVVVLALTHAVFSHRTGVHAGTGAVWLLLARNLAVVALAVSLTGTVTVRRVLGLERRYPASLRDRGGTGTA